MPDCQDIIYSNDYADFILDYRGPVGRSLFEEAVCQNRISSEYAVIHVEREENSVGTRQFIRYQNVPRVFGLLDTSHLEETGISRIRRLPGLDLYGQGVILGILDTGIDYRHPAFRNGDGTSRIGVIWDQSIPSDNPPKALQYGSVYTREDIDNALKSENPLSVVPSVDENGHGTFLAGLAGGNMIEEADFSGIAPLCELAIVKLKKPKQYLRDFWLIPEETEAFQETDIFTGIRFIMDYAARKNQPFVLLFGSGTNSGNHGRKGYLKNFLNYISDFSGRAIVLPAGNEGSLAHHYRGNGLEMGAYQDVEVHVGERERGFLTEIWAEAPDLYTIGFISPQGEYIEKIPLSVGIRGTEINFVFEKTKIAVYYAQVERSTGDMLIWIRMQDPTPGNWRFRIFKETVLLGRYDIWLPMEYFITRETYFVKPDPDTTICEPGNAEYPMTVTTYNHRNGNLFFQASRGFTRDNDSKPDVAAPGVDIYGPAVNGGYETRTGSSTAAAIGAGCAVLLLEYNRLYTGVQINNLMIKGADRMPGQTYPNKEWGYGKLNLYRSLESFRNTL